MAIFTFEDTAGDAALLDVHVSSNGLQDDWRDCKTIVRFKTNSNSYAFNASTFDEPGKPHATSGEDVFGVELAFEGNSELKALAHLFRSSADFLDYVCRQTERETDGMNEQ